MDITFSMPPLSSLLPHALIPLSCVAALASPPLDSHRYLWAFIITCLAYQSLNTAWPYDAQTRYSLRQFWFAYFPTITHLLFSNPERTCWRLDKGKEEAMYMEGFSKEKFRWAGALWVNPRGVGWSYQLKNVPEAEYMKFSRKRFIVRQMGSLFVHLIVLDACLWVLRNGLVPGRRSDEEIKEITQVRWAAIQTLITTMTYATCYIPWLAVSIVGVAFGLSEPKDWPPFFGHIRNCTTVGYYWGTYWHQALHKPVLDCGRFLVSALKIPRRTNAARVTYLVTSFTISGFFHAITFANLYLTSADIQDGEERSAYDYQFQDYTGYPSNLYVWQSTMLFFVSQAFGILLETAVIKVYERRQKRAGHVDENGKPLNTASSKNLWSRIGGYVWVWMWLFASGRLYADMIIRTDMVWWKSPLPVFEWMTGR